MLTRRSFLATAAAAWNSGAVRHILPTASHDRILLKMSLKAPLSPAPLLRVGGRNFTGRRSDSAGSFWAFDELGCKPATSYELELLDARGKRLGDPWPLR